MKQKELENKIINLIENKKLIENFKKNALKFFKYCFLSRR